MSGFVTTPGKPYSAYFPAPASNECGGSHGHVSSRGMGDLTTIGVDLANGNTTAVIGDLMPWASTFNVLVYAGLGIWWLFGGHVSDEENRKARSAALKQLDLEYQLLKEDINQQYPVKKKSKKKTGLAAVFG